MQFKVIIYFRKRIAFSNREHGIERDCNEEKIIASLKYVLSLWFIMCYMCN